MQLDKIHKYDLMFVAFLTSLVSNVLTAALLGIPVIDLGLVMFVKLLILQFGAGLLATELIYWFINNVRERSG